MRTPSFGLNKRPHSAGAARGGHALDPGHEPGVGSLARDGEHFPGLHPTKEKFIELIVRNPEIGWDVLLHNNIVHERFEVFLVIRHHILRLGCDHGLILETELNAEWQ